MQELYDSGTLHRRLGIAPKASISQQSAKVLANGARKSNAAERESVEAAWGAGPMELGSDEEGTARKGKEDSDVEESRYVLGRRQSAQHPSKRRKVGNKQESITVYTTDEDDDPEHADPVGDDKAQSRNARRNGKGSSSSKTSSLQARLNIYDDDDDKLSEEDAEYSNDVPPVDPSTKGSARPALDVDSRRSYWLSKGMGPDG